MSVEALAEGRPGRRLERASIIVRRPAVGAPEPRRVLKPRPTSREHSGDLPTGCYDSAMRSLATPALSASLLLAAGLIACGAADDASPPPADAPPVLAADGLDAADGGGDALAATTPPGCRDPGTPGATARCLTPSLPPEHYVAEALRYFDTLDVDADPESMAAYAELVARWEWPPWLLLTGFGRDAMLETSAALRKLDPSTVPVRDCRFFAVQPFARCRVVFEYEEGPCPIYEEFVFDAAGRTTFIEAWSDLPELRPRDPAGDPWAEADGVRRLATRVPGLGSPDGRIALDTPWMTAAAAADPEVADLALRATDWWSYWFDELTTADEDFFARGCGWGAALNRAPRPPSGP